MIDPQQHSDERGALESLLRNIPGFRGYLEQGYRQESDYLVRKAMADRLQRSKQGLDDYILRLVDAGRLDALTACERVRNRLDALILKMRGAVRGYSGFFDYVRVDQRLLDQVYQHDLRLVADAESLGESIEQLPGKAEASEPASGDLLARIAQLDQLFLQRGELLEGIRQDGGESLDGLPDPRWPNPHAG